MDDDETLTAYHEAGHAVTAYALGATVDSIQLGGEADDWLPQRFGECRVNWGPVDPRQDWQQSRELLTILAGPVAEMIYRVERDAGDLHGAWLDDWQRAHRMVEQMCPTEEMTNDVKNRLLSPWVSELDQQLRKPPYWDAIAAVADELLAHEFLEAEPIEQILQFWIR